MPIELSDEAMQITCDAIMKQMSEFSQSDQVACLLGLLLHVVGEENEPWIAHLAENLPYWSREVHAMAHYLTPKPTNLNKNHDL